MVPRISALHDRHEKLSTTVLSNILPYRAALIVVLRRHPAHSKTLMQSRLERSMLGIATIFRHRSCRPGRSSKKSAGMILWSQTSPSLLQSRLHYFDAEQGTVLVCRKKPSSQCPKIFIAKLVAASKEPTRNLKQIFESQLLMFGQQHKWRMIFRGRFLKTNILIESRSSPSQCRSPPGVLASLFMCDCFASAADGAESK